jgi:hypothetical protein
MRLLSVVLLGIAVAAAATEIPSPKLGPALLLRLEGVVGTDRAAVEKAGFTVTSFTFLGHGPEANRWLGVTDARTVGGDVAADGKDVLDAVAPFTPNFIASGDAGLVTPLLALPPGTAVRIEGLVDRGSRTFLVRSWSQQPPP